MQLLSMKPGLGGGDVFSMKVNSGVSRQPQEKRYERQRRQGHSLRRGWPSCAHSLVTCREGQSPGRGGAEEQSDQHESRICGTAKLKAHSILLLMEGDPS